METRSNTLRQIMFNSSRNDEFIKQLNNALKVLIQNDKSLAGDEGASPGIWECKWLNQSSIRGYSKGQAVWINTNDYSQIVQFYYNAIESYVTNNITLGQMYNNINKNDTAAVNNFFMAAAAGTASPNVSAIYYLGDIHDDVQIRISLKDNNKDYPSNEDSWTDFFSDESYESNVGKLLDLAAELAADEFAQHTQQYHIPGITETDLDKSNYFKKDPFSPDDVQTQDFFDHNYCSRMDGFDYVKRWKISPDGKIWCRVWNSGYIEQGGFVDNITGEQLIPVQFLTTYNYPSGASFYQKDYKSYNWVYEIDSPMQANNRYVVTVTPVAGEEASPYPARPVNASGALVYSSVDVTNMSNSGFSIVNVDVNNERYHSYSWSVCGYKVLVKDSQMFDNILGNAASGYKMFTIDGDVLVGFNNQNYSTVMVPGNVTSIAANVFKGCAEVKSFTLPQSLTSIGDYAFSNCNSIKSIAIPDSVKSIGTRSFSPCTSLAYADLGIGVEQVGTSAFCGNAKLADVSRFSDDDPSHTFNMVGDYAFASTSLRKVNLSLRSSSIYSFWGDYCFAGNTKLEEANILSSCYMSTGMFKGCTSLSAVNFKNNYTSYVYPNVFEGCTALKSITLPSKIWYISEEMFKGCTSLKKIEFTNYVDSPMINLIQKNAFYGCTSLQTLELPASITSINQLDDACLSNCSLASITFNGIQKNGLLKSSGEFVDEITKTGMKRLNHDCLINCKDGSLYFQYDQAKTIAYVEPTNYAEAVVDKTTTSGFKTPNANTAGKYWYYNAKQLKAQADKDHTPCLFIYSLLGCDPCQIYAKEIFNNKSFQDWAKKQKFYLCGLEVTKQPYYDKQLEFCVNNVAPYAQNFVREDEGQSASNAVPNMFNEVFKRYKTSTGINSNLYTPVLVFYHHRADGNVVSFAYSYHNISKYIEMWGGVDNVIECLKKLCLYYFDGNNPAAHTYVVDVASSFNASDYPVSVSGNPYEDPKWTITPKATASGTPLTTLDAVNDDIRAKIRPNYATTGAIDGYKIYLGGCMIDTIGYIEYTYPGLADCETVKQMNALINNEDNKNYKFKIGNSYYKLSFDETDIKTIVNPCSDGESKIQLGQIIWTKMQ